MRHIKTTPFLLVILFKMIILHQSFSQVNPCIEATAFHIVVLGSSTAAGAGANPSDSAWVNRYRSFLKNINPENEVTNLAVGGFNTYRIMPTGFTPPANRPQPDTNKNITTAIALAPDGIIVNLPSNDVSSGFSVAEQLANFDTIVSHASAAGIPIWVCTTQPKNYGSNQTNIQKQLDVRDSILAKYSPFVLDFWTGLADSTNQIDSAFDSGDGTHLNNAGHALLLGRVIEKDLPTLLFEANLTAPDYTFLGLEFIDGPTCGVPVAELQATVLNKGLDDFETVNLFLIVENLGSGIQYLVQSTMGSLASCEAGQTNFLISTENQGYYEITAIVLSSDDQTATNDTLSFTTYIQGIPSIETYSSIGCEEEEQVLQAVADEGDSIRWYDAQLGGNFIGGGPALVTPSLVSSTTYYAEAVRGSFHENATLQASSNHSIVWNGTMFDLVADTSLILDSITLVIADIGLQEIEVYSKQGSHRGFETDFQAWQQQGTYAAFVPDSLATVTFKLPNLEMQSGDSLALYIQLYNPSARLAYRGVGDSIVVNTNELTMIAGSGSNHNFGGSYYPRYWAGQLHYHHGAKPNGDCTTPRMPATATVNSVNIDLGADTILHNSATLLLDAGAGFANYTWSNGSSGQTLLLDGNVLGEGIHVLSVTATDDIGCAATDEIIVVFAPIVGTSDGVQAAIQIAPNPAQEVLLVDLPIGNWQLELIDISGKKWKNESFDLGQKSQVELALIGIPDGLYFLKMEKKGVVVFCEKIMVLK